MLHYIRAQYLLAVLLSLLQSIVALSTVEQTDASYLLPTVSQEAPVSFSGISIALNSWYHGYRVTLSRVRGSVCVFTPSCSHFSQEAIQRYGIPQGLLMTGDRLQRCHCCIFPTDYFRGMITVGDRTAYYDPVEDHDFWHNSLHVFPEKDRP